jgi:hypothetical protein
VPPETQKPSEPLFDSSDRVDDLPPELRGKSVKEIIAYYTDREKSIKSTYDSMLQTKYEAPAQPAPKQVQEPSSSDWWSNPADSAKRMIQANAVSKEEFDRITSGAQENLVQTARIVAKENISDWARFEPDIIKMMDTVDPWRRTSPEMWRTVYTYVKGLRSNELVKEAETRAKLPSEPVNPGISTPPPPETVTAQERQIAENLGISEKSFIEARKNMIEGRFPLTMSNIGR